MPYYDGSNRTPGRLSVALTIAVEFVWCIGFATTATIPSVTSRKSSNVERLQSYDEYGS